MCGVTALSPNRHDTDTAITCLEICQLCCVLLHPLQSLRLVAVVVTHREHELWMCSHCRCRDYMQSCTGAHNSEFSMPEAHRDCALTACYYSQVVANSAMPHARICCSPVRKPNYLYFVCYRVQFEPIQELPENLTQVTSSLCSFPRTAGAYKTVRCAWTTSAKVHLVKTLRVCLTCTLHLPCHQSGVHSKARLMFVIYQ